MSQDDQKKTVPTPPAHNPQNPIFQGHRVDQPKVAKKSGNK